MMKWFVQSCTSIILISMFFAPCARSAEIGCALSYGQDGLPKFVSSSGTPEATGKKLWPSGAQPAPNTCKSGFILGDIVKGDYEKFLAFYRNSHPFLGWISLDSRGGDAEEAMRIGRLLRKYLTYAVAPFQVRGTAFQMSYRTGSYKPCDGTDCFCASSCALIWFGAPERSGRIG